MSTAQILLLGAVAGLTIFLGLPVARMRSVTPPMKAFFTATATGILLFLLWDVLSAGGRAGRIGARERRRRTLRRARRCC